MKHFIYKLETFRGAYELDKPLGLVHSNPNLNIAHFLDGFIGLTR